MSSLPYESRLVLAIEAIQNHQMRSILAAAKAYNVSYTTLRQRLAGRPARRNILPNSCKLIDLEEESIVQYIINLYIQLFLPRLSSIKDIANQLLYIYNILDVG